MSHVFHARLPNFEIHAERMVDPALATRPVAVITSPAQNGTILSLSQEAREEGLAIGMRISLARKISRQVALLPFHQSLYQKMQGILFQRLTRFSPAVEPAGFGRFFLDMSGHAQDGPVAAVLDGLRKTTSFLQVLGSFPAAPEGSKDRE